MIQASLVRCQTHVKELFTHALDTGSIPHVSCMYQDGRMDLVVVVAVVVVVVVVVVGAGAAAAALAVAVPAAAVVVAALASVVVVAVVAWNLVVSIMQGQTLTYRTILGRSCAARSSLQYLLLLLLRDDGA
jgi:hypothetical protein